MLGSIRQYGNFVVLSHKSLLQEEREVMSIISRALLSNAM